MFDNSQTFELEPRHIWHLSGDDFARRLARLLLRLYPHRVETFDEALLAAWWRIEHGCHVWQGSGDKNEPDLWIEAKKEQRP
jgi:hypothetical protein